MKVDQTVVVLDVLIEGVHDVPVWEERGLVSTFTEQRKWRISKLFRPVAIQWLPNNHLPKEFIVIDRAARWQSAGVDGDDSSAEQIVAGHLDDAMLGKLSKVLVVLGEVIVRVRSVHRFQAEERVQVFLVVYVAQSLLQVPVLLEQVIV